MPEMTGLDLLRHLKSRAITLPVIVITGHGDVSLAIEAIKAGAVDFIEKPYDAEALLDAIKAAFSEHTRDATRAAEKTNIQQRIASLSAGERRILDALIAGRPNNAIAFDLQLSPRAVEINRASIMSKMQATNLSHLVRMALLAS
jgi:two-component system response regulator FixJ